jgi:hypothetical protein
MARNTDRNHYSKRQLSWAERTQELIGRSGVGKVGKNLINITNGSRHPGYLQLNWFSKRVDADVKAKIHVEGDQRAGLLPRLWMQSVLLQVDRAEIEGMLEDNRGSQEATAYMSEDVAHVGRLGNKRNGILKATSPEASAVAMRLGKGSLDATVGIWIPEERHFESVQGVEVVEYPIHIDDLADRYPGINLT